MFLLGHHVWGGTVLQRQLVSDSTLGNWAVALVLRAT